MSWTITDRLERGRGMRIERGLEAALLVSSFFFQTLVPVYAVLVLFVLQVAWPVLAPFALIWSMFERRPPADRLGNLYFDLSASRGACVVSSIVTITGLLAVRAGHPLIGYLLFAGPCASCVLAATVGFCAGCGWYVIGRDIFARRGWICRVPKGATDVEVARDQ
jgi:hypothetical protein